MSAQNRASVERFFAAWSESFDAVLASFDDHLADGARWEQSALPTTNSKAEAKGLLQINAWREFFDPRAALAMLGTPVGA